MNNKSKLILGFLALLLPFQLQAFAERSHGTITAIDSSGHVLDLVPAHGNTETAYVVKVAMTPGVKYTGVDSFDGLQVGDYVEINALNKSKTGSTLRATSIERKYAAAQNIHAGAAMQTTRTTVTTTTTTEPSVAKNTTLFAQTPVAATYSSTETIKDGETISSQRTTTTY